MEIIKDEILAITKTIAAYLLTTIRLCFFGSCFAPSRTAIIFIPIYENNLYQNIELYIFPRFGGEFISLLLELRHSLDVRW